MNLSNTVILYIFMKAAYNRNIDVKEVWLRGKTKLTYVNEINGQITKHRLEFLGDVSEDELEQVFMDALTYESESA